METWRLGDLIDEMEAYLELLGCLEFVGIDCRLDGLLIGSANSNALHDEGSTALMAAAENGSVSIVQALLKVKLKVTERN